MAKSSYFYHRTALSMSDKYAELGERVRSAFTLADRRYGYRRIHAVLAKDGETVSEKLCAGSCAKKILWWSASKRRYSSYMGEMRNPVDSTI